MNTRIQSRVILTVGSLLLVLGCAPNRASLVESNNVSVERMATPHVYFPWVDVFRENGAAVVKGAIRQRYQHKHSMSGHIDVLLSDPDGQVIEQAQASIRPHRLTRRGPKQAHFDVPLTTMPPDGAVIRVQYHNRPHHTSEGNHSSREPVKPLIMNDT